MQCGQPPYNKAGIIIVPILYHGEQCNVVVIFPSRLISRLAHRGLM